MGEGARRELGAAAFLIVAGALVAWYTLVSVGSGVQTDPLGPRAIPVALSAGIALCGVLLLAGRLLRMSPRPALAVAGPEVEEDPGPLSLPRLIGAIVATALYVSGLEPLGYLIATPLYVGALLFIHGGVPRRLYVVAPILVCLVLYAGFRLGLSVPLPGGVLEVLLPR